MPVAQSGGTEREDGDPEWGLDVHWQNIVGSNAQKIVETYIASVGPSRGVDVRGVDVIWVGTRGVFEQTQRVPKGMSKPHY